VGRPGGWESEFARARRNFWAAIDDTCATPFNHGDALRPWWSRPNSSTTEGAA